MKTFGHQAVHRGVELHPPLDQLLEHLGHLAGGEDEQGNHYQRQQRQPPLQLEHHHGGDYQVGDHRQAARGGLGDRSLRADDVAAQPAHQSPGLGAGEEGDRQALDVVEQRDPQIVDEALADPRVEVAHDHRHQALQRWPSRPSPWRASRGA